MAIRLLLLRLPSLAKPQFLLKLLQLQLLHRWRGRLKNPFHVQENVPVDDQRAEVVEEVEPKVVDEGSRKSRAQVGEQPRGNGVALVKPKLGCGGATDAVVISAGAEEQIVGRFARFLK